MYLDESRHCVPTSVVLACPQRCQVVQVFLLRGYPSDYQELWSSMAIPGVDFPRSEQELRTSLWAGFSYHIRAASWLGTYSSTAKYRCTPHFCMGSLGIRTNHDRWHLRHELSPYARTQHKIWLLCHCWSYGYVDCIFGSQIPKVRVAVVGSGAVFLAALVNKCAFAGTIAESQSFKIPLCPDSNSQLNIRRLLWTVTYWDGNANKFS